MFMVCSHTLQVVVRNLERLLKMETSVNTEDACELAKNTGAHCFLPPPPPSLALPPPQFPRLTSSSLLNLSSSQPPSLLVLCVTSFLLCPFASYFLYLKTLYIYFSSSSFCPSLFPLYCTSKITFLYRCIGLGK